MPPNPQRNIERRNSNSKWGIRTEAGLVSGLLLLRRSVDTCLAACRTVTVASKP